MCGLSPISWTLGLTDLEDLLLKLDGGVVVQGGMTALAIVPDLDELEDLALGLGPRLEHAGAKQLFGQRCEKALDDGVVP